MFSFLFTVLVVYPYHDEPMTTVSDMPTAKSHTSRVRLAHFYWTHAFPPATILSHAFFLWSYA